MQAVILVGGEGTRLRPLTYGTPKPMVPLFGVPFLERTLSRLKSAGVDHVILAAGYLPDAITRHLGDGARLGLKLTYVIEKEPLGTAGAIKNVEQYISGPFFVLNGDVLTSLDLRKMIEVHEKRGGLGVLHSIRVEDPSAFGCVVRDETGRVKSFIEKPPRETAPTDEINAGTYLLDPAVLEAIPKDTNVSIERATFPKLLAEGKALYAYLSDDYWLDVGRPDQYLKAHRDVLDRQLALDPLADPEMHRGAFIFAGAIGAPSNIEPPVFIGENVEIAPNAMVGPYTVLGDGTRIGPNVVVRGSVLWDGVHIEEGAHVTDVILASRVRVGKLAQVGAGTVAGHDQHVEPGTVVAPDSRLPATQAEQAAVAPT